MALVNHSDYQKYACAQGAFKCREQEDLGILILSMDHYREHSSATACPARESTFPFILSSPIIPQLHRRRQKLYFQVDSVQNRNYTLNNRNLGFQQGYMLFDMFICSLNSIESGYKKKRTGQKFPHGITFPPSSNQPLPMLNYPSTHSTANA